MTIETENEPPENDFAAFEAQAATGEASPVDDDEKPKADDQQPEDDDSNVNDVHDDDVDDDDDKGKKRSKPPHQRIAEITAARRAAERERDELAAELARYRSGQPQPQPSQLAKPDPNDDKYEYGEADPLYQEDLIVWNVEQRLAAREKEAKQAQREQEVTTELSTLDSKWNETIAKASEKYDDFNEVVVEGAAKEAWECPPIMAVAIQSSEVGADVAYELAKNPVKAAAIAATLAVDPMRAAEDFGEMEGAHLEKMPQRPPAGAHPMDLARYAGQVRAFANKPPKEPAKRMTNAPEPPKHNIRGAGGRFDVGADTTDFEAFEKKVMGRK